MNKENSDLALPKEGWAGLKENFTSDVLAGFVVFLLALPLSLGIAKASDFPPIMGLVSAIVGGLLATFLTGSKLTIKGPAAGLIVIVAGAVTEFGGGVEGWKMTLGVMVVAGILQILFGLAKLGKYVDFFPLSAVHGMLAAIGLIIIAKQIPVLLNVDPAMMAGKGPIALLASIPDFIAHMDPSVSIIGGISLAIMLIWPLIKIPYLKLIPAPLLVLIFAIPAGLYMNLAAGPDYTLVKVGNLLDQLAYNADFGGMSHMGIFVKYVIMVALVGSLESLLTVKAIDMLDPYKRKSDPNKDMIAIGVANTFAAFLGGIPMISEVARSSANVSQGAKTKWANFYHGVFLLVFLLLAYPLLEKIPNAALAAMLVTVGINLAHPKEFLHTYRIGSEQLAIFITTIFFTLFEDLLIGVAAGIVLKIIIHVFRGTPLKSIFRAGSTMVTDGNTVRLELGEAAIFSNYLGIKSILDNIPTGQTVTIQSENTVIVDHSVMENLHYFKHDYEAQGGIVDLKALDALIPTSAHPLSSRLRSKGTDDTPVYYDNVAFDQGAILHELAHYLPTQLALKDFVHHNSLHAFQDMEFFEAINTASKIFGIQVTFNLNEYRKLYNNHRISSEILDRTIAKVKGDTAVSDYRIKMLYTEYNRSYSQRVGQLRALWKKDYKIDIDTLIQPRLFRILSSYLDQGIALWHFPFEDQGLINAIRTLEQNSYVSFFKSKRAKDLLYDKNTNIEDLLRTIVGHSAYFKNYLFDQQFSHKGWSGLVAAIEGTPKTLLYQKKVSLEDLIKLELLLEIDALDAQFGHNWKPLAINLEESPEDYFAPVIADELDEILHMWQQAFEWTYYDEVLGAFQEVSSKADITELSSIPTFQAMFCVDDRECSIRRHIEAVDPNCETYGAPGYYGATIYFQPYGGKFYEKNCPVPAQPKHLIKEIEVSTTRGKEHFHSEHSHSFLRGFMYSLSLGIVASVRMVSDLFRPKMRADIADAFAHMDINGKLLIENKDPNHRENGLQVGYTVPEMAEVVYDLLSGIGLTETFAPVVYVVAHGSSSANNPHHGAHDCGACSGRPGAVNARVFSFMANHPKVRLILESEGISIPDATQFVGAMHDTASDEIKYYDIGILSEANEVLHKEYAKSIEVALDNNAKERARRFASIDINRDIKKVRKEIKARSVSYFEPRPELGHGTNALCYVGLRASSKGLFLDRRAFLQSYDYRHDPNGTLLESVMAPLPNVCGGINLEYYFSRMDVEKMGAGTKLPHNVVGLIGVANSSDGDLRAGLPLQMIENHDPLRLLMIVQHRPEVVYSVISKSPAIYDWFDKGWVHLAVISPVDDRLYHFENGAFHPYVPVSTVHTTSDIMKVIEEAKEMETNHIIDATKENIAVHIYPN